MNLSGDDFMKAIRDGKIPREVSGSKAGMLALQTRMDHINEMNRLMTSASRQKMGSQPTLI
jgi:hypothetical protein